MDTPDPELEQSESKDSALSPEIYALSEPEAPIAAPVRAESPASPATISEVVVARPLARGAIGIIFTNVLWFAMAIAFLAGAILMGVRGTWATLLFLGFVFGVAILRLFIVYWLVRHRAKKLIIENALAFLQKRFEEFPRRALDRYRLFGRIETYEAIVAALPHIGAKGVTIRIAPATAHSPVDAIAVPFEPRPIDTLSSWDLGGASPRGGATTIRVRGQGGVTGFLQSHWASAALALTLWLPGALHFYASGRPGFGFVIVSVWLIAALRLAVTQRAHVADGGWGQGYVVPGGLVFRRAAGSKPKDSDDSAHLQGENWSLHLFDRRKSVLCMDLRTMTRWRVLIADEHADVKLDMNAIEASRLLAAWLSPIAPPDVRRFSDLA